MKQVCARGEETHAREGKLWIRYVPEVREYMRERVKLWIGYVPEVREHMRKKKKDEIGMCQR